MAPGHGPLHETAKRIGQLGTQFHDAYKLTKGWPGALKRISDIFFFCYEKCYWAAHELEMADQRIESLGWDEFRWSAGAWLLVRLGADVGRAEYFRHRPWAWIIWKFRMEHLIFDALISRDFYWIGDYISQRWPDIKKIAQDPRGWVRERIVEIWPDFNEIRHFPYRWILVKLGADIGRAEFYRDRPWAWFIWKFRKEHLALDALLARDSGWLFSWMTEAIDKYLDTRLKWIKDTGERVLYKICEKEF